MMGADIVLHTTETTTHAAESSPSIGAFGGFLLGVVVVSVGLYVLFKNRDKKRCPDCATEYNPDFDRSHCFDCGAEMEHVSRPRLIDKVANMHSTEGSSDE